MKFQKFTLSPESILSTQDLSSLFGGRKKDKEQKPIEVPKPGPLPVPPIIVSPCDNA